MARVSDPALTSSPAMLAAPASASASANALRPAPSRLLSPELLELWAANPDPVLVFEPCRDGGAPEFRCVHANAAAQRACAPAGEALVGSTLSGRLPPERAAIILEALAAAVAGGQSYPLELEPEDAELGPVHRGTAVSFRGGFVLQLTDVQPMLDAERALRVSAARFRTVEELSLDGVLICRSVRDAAGTIQDFAFEYLNPAAADLIGSPASALIGRRMRVDHPSLGSSEAFAAYCRVANGASSEQLELHQDTRGKDSWWRLTCTPFEDGVAIRFSDVTAHRRAEAVSRLFADANAALSAFTDPERMAAQLATVLVPRVADWCCVILLDEAGSASRTAFRHVDPAQQQRVERLTRADPLDLLTVAQWPQALRTGESEFVPVVDSRTQVGAALSWLSAVDTASFVMVPLRVQQRVIGALGVGVGAARHRFEREDLGTLEELGRRAAVAIDNAALYQLARRERIRAEEASRAKDDFLAVVSHELRTPLTAILGWVRLLRGGALGADKRERALETVERNARLQAQLIEDLLDVSRIISGKLRLEISAMDATGVVEAALEGLRPTAEAKGVTLTATLPTAAPIHADSSRVQQVVWNLLSNAIKFTPAGGTVALSLATQADAVELRVTDSGVGIAPDFLPFVFERFRQADSSATRSHGGLGLGLAIVHHVVTLHGGAVRAESPGSGQGATFVVRLPVMPPDRASRPMAAPLKAQVPAEGAAGSLQGLSVLLVEDEADARELLGVVLERAGAQVTPTDTAQRALTALEQKRFDLMISDIGLPGTDGLSLMRAVRLLPSVASRMPSIALTAYARAEDRTRALLSGFDLYVSKPVDPAELLKLVKALTENRARVGDGLPF